MADFFIKQGDLLPDLEATLEDGDGEAINLLGCTVLFKWRRMGSRTTNSRASTLTNASGGVVTHAWEEGDTDIPGLYEGEFEVTFPDAKIQTFPNDSMVEIQVLGDLG